LSCRVAGIDLVLAEYKAPDYSAAFDFVRRERLDGVHVAASVSNYANRAFTRRAAGRAGVRKWCPAPTFRLTSGLAEIAGRGW
jgi:hypothetical protein